MYKISIEDFDRLVEEAVLSLPKVFIEKLENVDFVVEVWPSEEEKGNMKARSDLLLFGLYRGVPKTKRGSNYSALPDKIQIFAGPIMLDSNNFEDLKRKIYETVYHEIGHHFGLSDEQIYRARK